MKPLIPLLVLLNVCGLFASTYYVDFSSGSNTNSGTSAAAAWKNCPGDSAVTSTPAATALKAGDIVIFKGGVVYKGQTSVKWSGSTSAPIVYDGNSAGTWGAGKAVIDGENLRSYGFSAMSGTTSYVTLQNFEIQNIKYTGVPWQGGAAIKIDDATNVIISGCYFHDVGYWKNDGSIIPAGNGVHMLRPINCTITGCEITRTGLAGIEVDGSVNCIFSHNNIHDYITWGIDVGGDFNLCTGNDICDNTIHDLYQFDAGYWGIPNDPNIPHTDYIFLRQGGSTSQHPVKNIIERNFFYNNQTFAQFGGTAMLFLSYADSTLVRNNVFVNPHGYYATRFSWTSSGTKFYNNTIYAPNPITGSTGVGGVFLETNGYSDIRNNVMVTYQSSIAYTAMVDETGLKSDYNLFYNATSGQDFVRITPARYATFAQWQTCGYDTHSIHETSAAAVNFVNVAGYPTACQTMDLRLLSTSPAVNTGATLPGFANDMNSVSRPQGSAWDIGAYEFASAGVSPVVPTITSQPGNQTALVGQTATFTIAASGTAPIAYQWQRSNDNGTTWASVAGATTASFATAACASSDNGARFRCTATNSAGSATSSGALLTVNPVVVAPAITTQPANQTASIGQTATFAVAVSGTAPLSYLWQRSNDNGTTWASVTGATTASFATAACASSDNNARFRCTAANSAGSATSKVATLSVTTAATAKLLGVAFGTSPSWATGSEFGKASDNDTSTYFEYSLNNGGYTGIDLGAGNSSTVSSIRYFSKPGFEFRMSGGTFQGSNVSSSSGYVTLYTVPGTPAAGWNSAVVTDQNSYRFLRFASAAGVYCTIAEIGFYGAALTKPAITAQPANTSVAAGQTATFTVVATGSAPLAYAWQISSDNGATWNPITGATASSYTTPAVSVASNGTQYRCLVTNSAGTMLSGAAVLSVTAPVISKLTGVAFGTSPAWAAGSEFGKASDNDTSTSFEYSLNNGGYTGIDLGAGNSAPVSSIRYFSKPGFAFRMSGGTFQGSNVSSSSGFVTLCIVASTPPSGWNSAAVVDQTSYRFLRFVSAANVYCTIAEMEFYGTKIVAPQMTTGVVAAMRSDAMPAAFTLSQFAGGKNSSVIQVRLETPVALSEIRFDIVSLQGKCVASVVRREIAPGYQTIALDDTRGKLAAGHYLCRAVAGSFDKTVMISVQR